MMRDALGYGAFIRQEWTMESVWLLMDDVCKTMQ